MKAFLAFLKRLLCRHRTIEFHCNLYGEHAVYWGGKSLWKCTRCGNITVGKDPNGLEH